MRYESYVFLKLIFIQMEIKGWCTSLKKRLVYIEFFSSFIGHSHNLLELEAEKWRCTVTQAMQHLKQFVDNVQETARSFERIQQEIIPTHSRPEQGMFFYLFL